METTLINALRTKDALTENGMPTNSTTLNMCVDLFSKIGAMRGQDKQRLINLFVKAYNEDALMATKILFWARDIRGGSGERQIFKDILQYLANTTNRGVVAKNMHLIPLYGRWDDLFVFFGTQLESQALDLIADALRAGNEAKDILNRIDTLTDEECQHYLNTI